jgi:hypothetical protein
MPFDELSMLRARWSKRENDWLIDYPNGPDGHFMHSEMLRTEVFKNFVNELQERGYDTTTLRISVKKEPNHERWKKA